MIAAELDAYIESGRQRLVTIAQLPGMVYGLRTIQEAKGEGYIPPWTTLHYLFFHSPVFTGGVFLLDRAGKVLWTEPAGLPWNGQNLADYPPIAEMYQQGQELISSGFGADRLLNSPHVVVGVPIKNPDGEIDGILGGVIDLTAEGDGPVNALDSALRAALAKSFPKLKKITLTDYKVRILDGVAGTAAKTRVLITSTDGRREWGTVGVSENIIEASWIALVDSFEYKLYKDEGQKSAGAQPVAAKAAR
jgi:hypothetical protein